MRPDRPPPPDADDEPPQNPPEQLTLAELCARITELGARIEQHFCDLEKK